MEEGKVECLFCGNLDSKEKMFEQTSIFDDSEDEWVHEACRDRIKEQQK